MAKRSPFTAQQERLERRIKNLQDEVAAIKTMVDPTRSIVTAQFVKVDDPSSPQIIKVSEGGSLVLGSESPLRIVGVITEQSHTGDTAETELGKITIPADSMGLNGFVEIFVSFRGMGAGFHTLKVKFGGAAVPVRLSQFAGTNVMVDTPPTYVWNKGVANAQGSTIQAGHTHLRNTEGPFIGAEDTTADVDITITVQNSVAGDTSYVRLAVVKAFYQD